LKKLKVESSRSQADKWLLEAGKTDGRPLRSEEGTMGVRSRVSRAKKLRRVESYAEGRRKMDEKQTNPIRTIERSESLPQDFFVVPLPSEAVFLLPSVFFQRFKEP
jgi:hypothetical protein